MNFPAEHPFENDEYEKIQIADQKKECGNFLLSHTAIFDRINGAPSDLLFVVMTAIVIGFTVVAYSPTLCGGYFSDDYALQFRDQPLQFQTMFKMSNGYGCRPIEVLFMALVQYLAGLNTIPIHVVYLLMHCIFAIMIMLYMVRRGFSKVQAFIAFCVMALSQANSHAVASIDTFSQLTATISGYTCIVTYLSYLQEKKRNRLIIALLCAFVAIWCKETALFIIPCIITMASYHSIKKYTPAWRTDTSTFLSVLPFLAITGTYLLFRRVIGLSGAMTGNERYNISFGFNIVKNLVMSFFQAVQPHSSVLLYFDLVTSKFVSAGIVFLFVMIAAAFTLTGIVLSGKFISAVKIACMIPLTMIPAILFNHVSELYVYNMVPLCAVLTGLGIGSLLEKSGSVLKYTAGGLFVCFTVWNSYSIYTKCTLMYENGYLSEQLLERVQPFLNRVPHNGKLILVNPETSNKTEYSIFKRTGFRLFEDGTMVLNRRAGRDDFSTVITTAQNLSAEDIAQSFILKFEKGEVTPQ